MHSKPLACALTFDDGPDQEQTALVLDQLEKHRAMATFFVIGSRLDDSVAPLIRRMVSLGCEVGNHSWSWSSLDRASPEEIRSSVDRTSAAIERYAGAPPRFFRPPDLADSELLHANVHLPFVGGVLGKDWADTSVQQRVANVLAGVRDGAIILLHDVQPDPHPTPEALDILIPELRRRGYELVTVSELFRRKGVEPGLEDHRVWSYVE